MNRLEGVGETLRAVLNALATVAPDWLRSWVPDEWEDRYERAVDEYRLPKGIAARKEYAKTIGRDGMQLLITLYDVETTPLAETCPSLGRARQNSWFTAPNS